MKKNRILFTASLAGLFLVVIISAGTTAAIHRFGGNNDATSKGITQTSMGATSTKDQEVTTTESEETDLTSVPTTAQEDSNTESQTTTTAENPTNATETTAGSTTAQETETSGETGTSQDISESISFTLTKYSSTSYDFFVGKGYEAISNISQLKTYATRSLDTLSNQKDVKYLIAPKGTFDSMVNTMNTLRSTADTTEPDSIYARDSYLYTQLNMDYQKYYAMGIATFFITKVQTAGSYDIYALCYYSYETKAQIDQVNTLVNEFASTVTGSDYEKILKAHDYLMDQVTYEESDNSLMVHTAYAALVSKKAVCEGYAKAYKLLLNAMGISSDIVINQVHAWNEVYFNNAWYFVDITNNDASSTHALFLLGKDVLYYQGDLTIDNITLNASYITTSYYDYQSGKNTSQRSLSDTSILERNIVFLD